MGLHWKRGMVQDTNHYILDIVYLLKYEQEGKVNVGLVMQILTNYNWLSLNTKIPIQVQL